MRHDFQGQNGCSTGRHEIESATPFGLWVWGWGSPETQGGQCNLSSAVGFTCNVSYGYPAGMNDRCGDGWVAPITLSTDWQIYVIPFTEFRQIGFGKPAPFLDLKSIYEVAFLLPVGWADVWIDNITFYRRR
jgi:hypothetical protein